MNFKEAMEHYRAGTATGEERQLVEQELEKNRLIAEYLEEEWDDVAPIQPAPVEELRLVRKELRKRNTMIVLTSLALAAALFLGIVYVGIPVAENQYWDPTCSSFGEQYTDLELTLAAYDELFCPDVRIDRVNVIKTGFASYSLTIRYDDAYGRGDSSFSVGSIQKNELDLAQGVLDLCPANVFERATYPFYPGEESRKQAVVEKLSELPDYVTVVAAVSFPKDMSMAEIVAFQDTLIDGRIAWAAIRTAPMDQQMYPLCGMDVAPSGYLRAEANREYPFLDIKGMELTAENLETHFRSLLCFSEDRVRNGTGIPVEFREGRCYYADARKYVEENGAYSYGCYVVGTPETFLSLLESGAVSQVWIEDIWISP